MATFGGEGIEQAIFVASRRARMGLQLAAACLTLFSTRIGTYTLFHQVVHALSPRYHTTAMIVRAKAV